MTYTLKIIFKYIKNLLILKLSITRSIKLDKNAFGPAIQKLLITVAIIL